MGDKTEQAGQANIKDRTNRIEQINNLRDELDDYQNKKPFGIDADQLSVYIQSRAKTWKFKEDLITRQKRREIMKIKSDTDNKMRELSKLDRDTALEELDLDEAATKQILEMCLEGFNYDTLCDVEKVNPNELTFLAGEIYSFLVVNGGSVGLKHSQMQSKMIMLNHLISSTMPDDST